MTKKSLLEQAFIDAQSVKDTAIANAKIALLETFSPKLQSMFAETLDEMEEEDTLSEEEENLYEEEFGMEDSNGLDYESIINSIEESDENLDLYEETEVEDEVEIEDEPEVEDEVEIEDEEEEVSDEAEISLEDMTEDELRAFIEDVVAEMYETGEITGETPAEDSLEVTDDTLGMPVDSPEEMDGSLEMDDEEEEEEELSELVFENKRRSNREKVLEKQLKEALDTVQAMRKILNETKLVNAKLLYLTKLYKNTSLTENQKTRMLNSLDKAKTVREAKLIYESLTATIKPTTKVVKKTGASRQLTENLSGASRTVKSVVTTEPIITDPLKKRFQELAGITGTL